MFALFDTLDLFNSEAVIISVTDFQRQRRAICQRGQATKERNSAPTARNMTARGKRKERRPWGEFWTSHNQRNSAPTARNMTARGKRRRSVAPGANRPRFEALKGRNNISNQASNSVCCHGFMNLRNLTESETKTCLNPCRQSSFT
jgi:hypothetical protein